MILTNSVIFLKAIGKFIDSSGLPKLMVESGLLAEGSVREFLAGSHFNRCKRLHPVAALSLKILHFKQFLLTYEKNALGEPLDLSELIDILERDAINFGTTDVAMPELAKFLERYQIFTKETLSGSHGYTAQFALMYVTLVELYLLLERGIRTSDVALFNHAAHEICALFFAFNHQYYARWLTRNHDNFMNITRSHPGLWEDFESGALSVRRTAKNFCRSPVDLTLEQTINANAANRLTGVTCLTNNIHARQRWSETHTARMAIISHFFEFLHLAKFSETSDSQYQSRVFSKQVQKFTEQVCDNINPFNVDVNPEILFNLSTGKAASSETATFLLNVTSIGAKQRDDFIQECATDGNRFNRPIKRNNVKNFAVENLKHKTSSVTKTNDADVERNVLGHVLCYVMQNRIDLLSVLSYPLTTHPHSLAHCDGTMISNSQKG